MLDQFLTVSQASTTLQITKATLYRWIQDKRIPAYRIRPNAAIRIRLGDIIEPYSGKTAASLARGAAGLQASNFGRTNSSSVAQQL